MEIRPILPHKTHHLRLTILRNNDPTANLNYPGDTAPETGHFGAFQDKQLVGIASVYSEAMAAQPEKHGWRLRGMAVVPEVRRTGIGAQLIERCIQHCADRQGQLIWCNARTSAQTFYEAQGFAIEGKEFELPEIGPHFVMWKALSER